MSFGQARCAQGLRWQVVLARSPVGASRREGPHDCGVGGEERADVHSGEVSLLGELRPAHLRLVSHGRGEGNPLRKRTCAESTTSATKSSQAPLKTAVWPARATRLRRRAKILRPDRRPVSGPCAKPRGQAGDDTHLLKRELVEEGRVGHEASHERPGLRQRHVPSYRPDDRRTAIHRQETRELQRADDTLRENRRTGAAM